MHWIGLYDQHDSQFNPEGLGANSRNGSRPPPVEDTPETLLPVGSIVLETTLTQGHRPQTLMAYASGGKWSLEIALRYIPGGGVTLILDHSGDTRHATVRLPYDERLDSVRITFAWDAPAQKGRLSVEDIDKGRCAVSDVPAPPPLRLADLRALTEGGNTRYITSEAAFLAISSAIEPIGPMPTLTGHSPVLTPDGEKPVAALNRGDTVYNDTGAIVPVLYRIRRTVPARGSFAPIRLRAPFFGLTRDTIVSPAQRLKLSGSEVEYLFGSEAVLANARHLTGPQTQAVRTGPVVTYHQLILPHHDAIIVSGSALESLNVGRIRRKRDLFPCTLLADIDRSRLPEHATAAFPLLRQYDALVLADQRSA